MDVNDYYSQGKRWWFRLHEKGGKQHEMPAHHKAEEFVDAYMDAANLWEKKHEPIFRAAIGKTKQLGPKRMSRHAALKMIQRRAKNAGILTPICCHSFRATGITNYLENDGTLEKAQQMGQGLVGSAAGLCLHNTLSNAYSVRSRVRTGPVDPEASVSKATGRKLGGSLGSWPVRRS